MKRFVSVLMVLVSLASLFTTVLPSLAFAENYPSLSSSAYCEFVARSSIPVYRSSDLKTRGTSNPANSYNAYVDPADVCYILQASSNWLLISYPTSSGRRQGFVSRNSVLPSTPTEKKSVYAQYNTLKTPGGAVYGYVEKGDTAWLCGSVNGYVAVIYTAKSGSRAYKLGWMTSANYQASTRNTSSSTSTTQNTNNVKTVNENDVIYTYITVTVDTSSPEKWMESVKNAENNVCNSGKGVIVAAKAISTKTVSWRVSAAAVYAGPGITGYVTRQYTVPSVIQYKLHTHTRNMGFGKSWYYSGGSIMVIYTCNCGYREELMEWTIPLPDFAHPQTDAQTTKKVIQGLPQIN